MNFIRIGIAFLLLFPLTGQCQDCSLHRETDPYTRETKLSTGFISLNNASVTLDADSKEIDIFFALAKSSKCFDNNSSALVFFEGTRSRLMNRNTGTMNCEGFFHITVRNLANPNILLQKMSTQKVASFVFVNAKDSTKVTLVHEQQTSLMNFAACIVNEAKALIK